MKRILWLLIAIYIVSYIGFRAMNAETWDQDNQVYVIYPTEPIELYYLYRPLSYLDGALTGMRTHIGPHP